TANSADAEDAGRRVDRFADALAGIRARGTRLVWTVHNVLPHLTTWPALEVSLREGVIARADIVHVLSIETIAAAAPFYEIPTSKVLHLPHPAYLGVYPDDVSDAEARTRLGIGPDDVVFGIVGSLQPYKGIDDLLDAFESVVADPPDKRRRRLLIAGMPAADPAMEALLERAGAHPDVILMARRIGSDELSVPLRASDVIVLPYRASLNSGALMLALTFGRPVIAAASPHVTETVGPEAAITFEAGDRDALEHALRNADRLLTGEARSVALATAERYDPGEISATYARALRERFGVGAGG
ncbi:MAG: glycosyltransferase, partial [Candidatus Limnocylindrales bacterium]